MRDYSKVSPQFWTGTTGKKLKSAGTEAVIVAMYLMTSPSANMIGLFYIPVIYIAHETGLGFEGASRGLKGAIEAGFCTYDEASEYVFVHEMARYQIAGQLKSGDKQCKGVENELSKVPKGALELAFREKYGNAFHIKTTTHFEGPLKALRSQEQEQEQEQDKELESANADLSAELPTETPPASAKPAKHARPPCPPCPHDAIIAAYHEILPELPAVRSWTDTRRKHLQARWRESGERQEVGWWQRFFSYVRRCPWLMGGGVPGDGRSVFRADLGWLVKPENFAKVLEGRYEKRAAA